MGLSRKVGFFQGLRYKGGGPMLSWMLHRVSGIGMVVFVGVHIISSFFMQQLASDIATSINIIYESWIFQIIVIFTVVFHAINGLRIIILDIWPKFIKFQREILWLQWFIFVPIYSLVIFILVQTALGVG